MKILKMLVILVLVASMASFAIAAEKRQAKIAVVNGRADVKLMDEKQWIPAKVGMALTEGDTIRTKSHSWVMLTLNGAGETATVELEENAKLTFSELIMDKGVGTQQTLLDLAMGEILIKAQKLHSKESRFEVKTPTSMVGVRGTTFSVKVEAIGE